MVTYQQYRDGSSTHKEYFGQFVTPNILALVRVMIGSNRIIQSTDQHLNDIPLQEWSNLVPAIERHARATFTTTGGEWCLGFGVCIAKAAATRIQQEALVCE
jgi:hypothetical protein